MAKKNSKSIEASFNEGCGIKKSKKPYPGYNPQKGVGKDYQP